MKTKILLFLTASCILALVARAVQGPSPAQVDELPEKYRDTVHKGLEYLAKQQHKDGHWEGDDGKHPVAMTGLVGLALLMERNAPSGRGFGVNQRKAKYEAQIGKAADWLMEQSQAKREGLIFSEHASETARYMQGHGLATLFLAGVCQDEPDEMRRKKLTDILTRAVQYIVKAQSTDGGWYPTSKAEGHDFAEISTTVIQIQALQAAENAGIPGAGDAIRGAQVYLERAVGKNEGKGTAAANIAGALACRHRPSDFSTNGRRDRHDLTNEVSKRWFKYCQSENPVGRDVKIGRDELAAYYCAQAMFNIGGNTWTDHRTPLFDHLQKTQREDGSWLAGDGIGVGPNYSTALWCIVLQLDKWSHPTTPLVTGGIVT